MAAPKFVGSGEWRRDVGRGVPVLWRRRRSRLLGGMRSSYGVSVMKAKGVESAGELLQDEIISISRWRSEHNYD